MDLNPGVHPERPARTGHRSFVLEQDGHQCRKPGDVLRLTQFSQGRREQDATLRRKMGDVIGARRGTLVTQENDTCDQMKTQPAARDHAAEQRVGCRSAFCGAVTGWTKVWAELGGDSSERK